MRIAVCIKQVPDTEKIRLVPETDTLLCDGVEFAGSDTLATSYALSKTLTLRGPYDLILCGKQAVAGDTAQVGPACLSFEHSLC
ncbi:electron transfer flavoprotein subunit beta [Desulfotalea psychrophila]|uniref:Related to electron transfer flavoprotein, beta-subunit n=1 Tax=Desulfotalea psychrophila (strain LSv54 / DSM 12343) TaxID=177439 RepID=Q6AJF9_DESPS|nr:electron transfer flavoprotein subunit beta [Desulfotalea psychrophila]CAG37521.1 related to electron transfer flavoprotein, beta-subunit [Desulfotalea psychrophila LSv54]